MQSAATPQSRWHKSRGAGACGRAHSARWNREAQTRQHCSATRVEAGALVGGGPGTRGGGAGALVGWGPATRVVWEPAPSPVRRAQLGWVPVQRHEPDAWIKIKTLLCRCSCPRCYTTTSSLPVSQNNSKMARLGVFELDISAGELRKNGRKLRLQEQPFQILALLLERAGDVVTREELRQKLWPADTFVDFDHGLNTAVNKLREVLGDSAASPRFIETLARRGYRFIAPVKSDGQSDPHTRAEPAAQRAAPAPQESKPETQHAVDAGAIHPDLDVPIPRRGLTRGLFALIQVMYLSFYLSALFRLHIVQNI